MTDRNSLHVPPHSIDAELSLLGCFALDSSLLDYIPIQPEQFYVTSHAICCRTMQDMRRTGQPIDAVTLGERLIDLGLYEQAGGYDGILRILEAVPHVAHAEHYAAIVRDKWLLRQGIDAARQMIDQFYTPGADPEAMLADAAQSIARLSSSGEATGLISLAESCQAVLQDIERRQAGEDNGDRLFSGFVDLDDKLGGFRAGQMIVLAARPGIGKTALALNIAANVMKAGHSVLFVSLEMSHKELTERLLSSETGINSHDIASGRVSAYQFHELQQAAERLADGRLHYLDSKFSLPEITAQARAAYRKHGVRFVVVDYLHLVSVEVKRGMLREQAVAQVSRGLKELAMTLSIPVLALSQLNREIERRDNQTPRLSDLRESGSIEQDANMVLFLHRPDAHDAEDRPGQANVIVAKHRTGPTGVIPLTFQREFCRFESLNMPDVDIEGLMEWGAKT